MYAEAPWPTHRWFYRSSTGHLFLQPKTCQSPLTCTLKCPTFYSPERKNVWVTLSSSLLLVNGQHVFQAKLWPSVLPQHKFRQCFFMDTSAAWRCKATGSCPVYPSAALHHWESEDGTASMLLWESRRHPLQWTQSEFKARHRVYFSFV